MAQRLEQRCLLSISSLTAAVSPASSGDAYQVNLGWQDSKFAATTEYEVWIDQIVTTSARIEKVYYQAEIPPDAEDITHNVQQEFSPGSYQAWVRSRNEGLWSEWISRAFDVDSDGDPETPIELAVPRRPQVTVIREGQGAAGQAVSEGGIGWIGDSSLYDVWLGKRDASGVRRFYTLIRNVPSDQ